MKPRTLIPRVLRALGWGVALAGLAAPAWSSDLPQPAATGWSPAALRHALGALPAGDVKRGAAAHDAFFCASCHGAQGVAHTLNWPHLAGQRAQYTAKMLLDYQRGLRRENQRAALMHDVAVMLSPQHIADLSAYYASLPLPTGDSTPRPGTAGWSLVSGHVDALSMRVGTLKTTSLTAHQLVRQGDPQRLITPCASCHGTSGQGGNREAPALAGQNPLYFVRTLLDYQSGVRANDSHRGMRVFAHKLTRTEIETLAGYYADLPSKP